MVIQYISDTARWVAHARAVESKRSYPILLDSLAERLAGVEGKVLSRSIGDEEMMASGIAVRTVVFDDQILATVKQQNVDLVLNLAAGLDTRPWRLDLPTPLQWIDVDLPDILRYKARIIGSIPTACRYEALHADVTSATARKKILDRCAGAQRILVVSEGLLVHLTPAQVAAIAQDLHTCPTMKWWLTDLSRPQALLMLQQVWGPLLRDVKFQFGPADGVGFFDRLGWRETVFHSALESARQMGRGNSATFLNRALLTFSSVERREEFQRLSGISLFINKAASF